MAYNADSEMKFSMNNSFFDGHTERSVSADAASIVACLYAINYLLGMEHGKAVSKMEERSLERLYDHYYQLRNFAGDHIEAEAIFALID